LNRKIRIEKSAARKVAWTILVKESICPGPKIMHKIGLIDLQAGLVGPIAL
jgi:hypothetical protein